MDDQAGVGHQTDEALGSRQLARTIAEASRLAGEVIALMAAIRDQAAQQGEAQLRAAQASARDRHRQDAAVWRMATQRWWWDQATDQDIAAAWTAASTWAPEDEQAAAVQRHIAGRLARRGVQVTAPDARPGDAAWLREAGAAAAQDPETGPRYHLTDDEAQRLTDLARAHWTARGRDADAAAILGTPGQDPPDALPAFLYRLGQYEALGGRVTDALDGVWLPDDVYHPAAFAAWWLEKDVRGISEIVEERRGRARDVIARRLAALDALPTSPTGAVYKDREVLVAADRDIAQAINPLPMIARLARHRSVGESTRDELDQLIRPVAANRDDSGGRARNSRSTSTSGGRKQQRRSRNRGAERDRSTTTSTSGGRKQQRRSRHRGARRNQTPPDPAVAAGYEQAVRRALQDMDPTVVDGLLSSPWWANRLAPALHRWKLRGNPPTTAMNVIRRAVTDPQVAMPAAWAAWQLRTSMDHGTPHPDPRMAAVRSGHPGTARDAAAAEARSASPPTPPAARHRAGQQQATSGRQRG
jgi:hypothetical protein